MKVGIVNTTSYNGIAAVNVDGSSICSTFQLHDTSDKVAYKPLETTKLNEMKHFLNFDNMCLLILDEVSTIDSRIIGILDNRFRQFSGNTNLPFGGMPMLFCGDFNQLGPVRKSFLPKDMMQWALREHKNRTASASAPNSSFFFSHCCCHCWKGNLKTKNTETTSKRKTHSKFFSNINCIQRLFFVEQV